METTLNKIRAHSPSPHSWHKLLANLGKTRTGDEPLDMLTILESNGLQDALWCLQAVEGHDAAIRKLACDYALSVAHLWDMPDVVRQYLETQDESIRIAAREAAQAAQTAWDAARAAAWATWAAAWAAAQAARDAAEDVAGNAAMAAAWAGAQATLVAIDTQTELFRKMCEKN